MVRVYESFSRAVQCPDDEIDLGRAALAIAHSEYPDLKIESYLSRMDGLASAVRDRAGGRADCLGSCTATSGAAGATV